MGSCISKAPTTTSPYSAGHDVRQHTTTVPRNARPLQPALVDVQQAGEGRRATSGQAAIASARANHGSAGGLTFQARDIGTQPTPDSVELDDKQKAATIPYQTESGETRYTLKHQAPLPTNRFDRPLARKLDLQRNNNHEHRVYTEADDVEDKLARELETSNRNLHYPEMADYCDLPVLSEPNDPQSTSGQIDLLDGEAPGNWERAMLSEKPDFFTVTYQTLPSGAGEASRINQRPEKEREDRTLSDYFSLSAGGKNTEVYLSGVFDGHGSSHYAEHAQKVIVPTLKEKLELFNPDGLTTLGMFNGLKLGFVATARSGEPDTENFEHQDDGTTANVTLIFHDKLWVANTGDSSAILITPTATTKLSDDAKAVTHNPTTGEEQPNPKFIDGVVKRGGEIGYQGRVNNNLAITRALGDHAQVGTVSARPKLIRVPLADAAACEGHYIVQVSDGITDVMSPDTIAERVNEGHAKGYTPAVIASRLVEEAARLGSRDDLTAVVTPLDQRLRRPSAPTDIDDANHETETTQEIDASRSYG
ncbi:PP2C family serine/threonine-protein phosphatase [Bordetella sp. LUAb4]|uniref:PP2C family serine/threonine-protein phosphatase n=1 Tax=Bordetella sp. LUAb4 TaxID=2843195 RepID=UPI001E644DEE|nr:PP2C family protein-serine/threonine phosphatase [Bordetella sp. LUAb4]